MDLITFFELILLYTVSKIGMYGLLYVRLIYPNLFRYIKHSQKPPVGHLLIQSKT